MAKLQQGINIDEIERKYSDPSPIMSYSDSSIYKKAKDALKSKRSMAYLKFCIDWSEDVVSKKVLCEQFANNGWIFADFILNAKRHKLYTLSMNILEYADDFATKEEKITP